MSAQVGTVPQGSCAEGRPLYLRPYPAPQGWVPRGEGPVENLPHPGAPAYCEEWQYFRNPLVFARAVVSRARPYSPDIAHIQRAPGGSHEGEGSVEKPSRPGTPVYCEE
jgi:hypothetical protein